MKSISVNNYLLIPILFLAVFACNNPPAEKETLSENSLNPQPESKEELVATSMSKNPTPEKATLYPEFEIPQGYVPFDTVQGDLNGDQIDDYVLIIKATKKEGIVVNRFDVTVDRNRRGILVFLSENEGITLSTKNLDCFSSENEDGGVYFPPDLGVIIENEKLFLHYAHGRYGYWKYTFRYQQNAFKLIGYDQSENMGPVVHYFNSYNFLTGRKLTKENVNFYSENPQDEVFKETWEDLPKSELKKLVSITDFDELDFD